MKTIPAALALAFTGFSITSMATPLDTVIFGNSASESAHSLVAPDTQTISGGMGEPARRCRPLSTVDYYGGTITVTMQVDPVRRNYFSVKLWSDDDIGEDMGRLYLYIVDGGTDYQVGFRHEGDYMPLSVPSATPGSPGQFFYSTTLLPLDMTLGKTTLTFKIVSTGRLYSFGTSGEIEGGSSPYYQYLMDTNSRGIYRAYTHVDPFLDPAGEVFGSAPAATARTSPGPEVLAPGGTYNNWVKNRINSLLGKTVNTDFGTYNTAWLSRSYNISQVSAGYHQSTVLNKVVAILDFYTTDYYANPSTSVWAGGNEGWGGRFGYLGKAICDLQDVLTPAYLDATVDYGTGGSKTRREAWGDMLYASREDGRLNRRTLSNQTLYGDHNIYFANRGLLILGDSRAFTENDAQRYLREACGMENFKGDDLPGGGYSWNFGTNYFQVTAKGLTREWGYVGSGYGEKAHFAAEFYAATTNTAFRDQAIKMGRARAPFRRPAVEVDGSNYYNSMQIIGLLAWRGAHEADGEFGNGMGYADKAPLLRTAAATLDPVLVGYAKQMIEDDNQFFSRLVSGTYDAYSLEGLEIFDDYATIAAQPDAGYRLPMTDGQPDFAWADEGSRILALKHGDDRLWISPYWQAREGVGINGIARFQFSNADYTQYGVLETVPQFTFGGFNTRSATFVDSPRDNRFVPNAPLQAYGNEALPQAPVPDLVTDTFISGAFVGKADFYAFRFGPYLMGLNATEDKSYTLKTPNGFTSATDLISGNTLNGTITVAPTSSVALVLSEPVDAAPVPVVPLYLGLANSALGMDVSWSAASGADSYTILRSVTSGGPYTVAASGVADLSWTDTNVVSGQTYYYEVMAVNTNGESYKSCERSITALTSPDVISFNFLNSMTSADNAGAPGVRVANWNIFNGGTLSTGIVDGAGQTVPGMSVTLSMGSVSSSGLSDRGGTTSDDVSMFRTVLDQFNGTPSTISITGIPFSSYDVYFYVHEDENTTGANDRGGRFTVGSTTYYIRTGSDTKVTTSDGSGYIQSSDTTFGSGMDVELGNYVVFTNLSGNLSASMVAVNINGGAQRLKVSGFQIVKPSTAILPPPATPQGLGAAASSSGQLELSWSAAAGADSYAVKRSDSSGGPYTPVANGVTNTHFSDSGLEDGATYYYVVSANGAGGESADSNVASAIPSAPVAPDESVFDSHALSGGTNLSLVASNSVIGHLYQLLATESLVPMDWQPVGSALYGNSSNILFDVPVTGIETNRFFKLDVQRQ